MTTLKTLNFACLLFVSSFAAVATEDIAGSGSGTVVETMNVGTYVYVRLAENATWVAATATPVVVGDQVRYSGGALMKNFYSSKLDRRFDSIVFVMKLETAAPVDAKPHGSAAANNPHRTQHGPDAALAPAGGEIEPLDGGKTIAEIYAEMEQLEDQQVALRARVMKVSLNILGKNWITLQDGTGSEHEDRLIATSAATIAIGDLVVVRGVLHSNVDLGSGYRYKVLLEDARFEQ